MTTSASELIDRAVGMSNAMSASANSALYSAMDNLASASFTTKATTGGINFMPGVSIGTGAAPTYEGQRFVPPEKYFLTAIPPEATESSGTVAATPEEAAAAAAAAAGRAVIYGANGEPTLNVGRPELDEISKPTELGMFNKEPPTTLPILVPELPDALRSMDFTPPQITQFVVPTPPSKAPPEFLAVRPTTDLSAPTDLDGEYRSAYAEMSVSMRNNLSAAVDAYLNKIDPEFSGQMARLEAKLAQYIEGGTALAPEVEQAIFNRARDKTNAEYLITRDQIMKEGASKGFTIPGGAQYSALAQARQAASDNNARAAMEIAIKQAELEQANVQFAVTQSSNLRGVVLQAAVGMMGQLVQINGQAIQYAQALLQSLIALYDVKVKLATAAIDIYKADAQVFEVKLKATLAEYDIYKAHIEGLRARTDVEKAVIDGFTAKMNGLGALATVYKASVDGAVAQAQIEKLKVEVYAEHVRAYSATVGAKQAEWAGYSAQVQGQVVELNAYEAEIKAYTAAVGGYTANLENKKVELQKEMAKSESAWRIYTAATDAYKAEVMANSEAVKAEISSFGVTLDTWKADAAAKEAQSRVTVSVNQGNLQAAIQKYSLEQAERITESKLLADMIRGYSDVAVSAGGVFGNMAGSAMAGINSLVAVQEITSL